MLGVVGVWLVHKSVNNFRQCRSKQDSAETDQRKSRLGAGRQDGTFALLPVPVSPFTACEVNPRTSQGLMCDSGVVDEHGQKSRSLTGDIRRFTGRPAGLCAILT